MSAFLYVELVVFVEMRFFTAWIGADKRRGDAGGLLLLFVLYIRARGLSSSCVVFTVVVHRCMMDGGLGGSGGGGGGGCCCCCCVGRRPCDSVKMVCV